MQISPSLCDGEWQVSPRWTHDSNGRFRQGFFHTRRKCHSWFYIFLCRGFLFSWSRQWDSNPRPAVYKTATLTPELQRHVQSYVFGISRQFSRSFLEQSQHKNLSPDIIRPVNTFESGKPVFVKKCLEKFFPVMNNMIEHVAAQAGE